jgi:glycosyltransferase involved in cell wall biosynthesis
MRVLHISSARTFGGGERHLLDLARGLSQRGHEVFVALSADSPLHEALAAVTRHNVFTLSLRNALDLGSALKLSRLARALKVEIIHAHVARDYTLAAFAARRATAARLIITRHLLFPLSRAHRLALSNVSRVIAVSEAVARTLRAQKIFDEDKIRVITNGTDVWRFEQARAESERAHAESERAHAESERTRAESERERDPSFRPLRVGILGELSEVKGQEDFVRAARVVAERFGDGVEFLIGGEDASRGGEYRARIERLVAQSGLGERVKLLGRLDGDDVMRFLTSLDLLVSASRSEAFGMALVEALACGVPVVATATEGASEIVEEGVTGSLVPLGDVRALAAAVASLLEDDERRRSLSARAREVARERFDLNSMVEATERVYAEALGHESSPRV